MIDYPLDKYCFYFYTSVAADGSERRVVKAVSSYGGHIVSGIAKCSPNDTYDEEVGKRLAAYRCAQKIAKSKIKRAGMRMDWAVDNFNKATAMLQDAGSFFSDAQDDLSNCNAALDALIAQCNK